MAYIEGACSHLVWYRKLLMISAAVRGYETHAGHFENLLLFLRSLDVKPFYNRLIYLKII